MSRKRWLTDNLRNQFGKVSDRTIAEAAGVVPSTITKARQRFGLPAAVRRQAKEAKLARVIDAMRGAPVAMTVSELVAATGFKVPVVRQLLHVLLERECVYIDGWRQKPRRWAPRGA